MGSQWLQMQFKKTIMQSSTFSLLCGIRLISFSKDLVKFNWENNKLQIFAKFLNIKKKIS